MQLLKKVFVGAVTFLGIALAPFTATAGDLQQQLTSESVIETITKRGKMKVGMSTFVPWAMRDKQGELIGFEIDVAKKVAADLGVDASSRLSTLKVVEPAKREAGVKVADVAELVDKLRNEAKVI